MPRVKKGGSSASVTVDTGPCLRHVEAQWARLVFTTRRDAGLIIGLPHPYVAPSAGEFEAKQYYWDTYFTLLGLVDSGRVGLASGMVDNLVSLFERFGFIPQSNRFYHLAKSNPPLLSSMARELFAHTGDRRWLRRCARAIEGEYLRVWTAEQRQTPCGLSRYWDPTHYHEQAEDESGWDRTSRFRRRCLDMCPVDLNALLYKYETDMQAIHETLGEPGPSREWRRRAVQRRRLVARHHWHPRLGFFFDYDWRRQRRSLVWTLAGFFPLWAGLATEEQAEGCRRRLARFEHRGGLATTDRRYSREQGQWDFPNGWAPLHWIVIDGLRRYGFHRDADRVAQKWLGTCIRGFESTGQLWERYDVVRRRPGLSERYPIQSGFGWTNGVFVRLAGRPTGAR